MTDNDHFDAGREVNRAPGHNDEYRKTLNKYRRSLDIALWFTIGLVVIFVALGLLTLFTS